MTTLLFADLTYKIIGAAMEAHNTLGSGFLEAVYEAALAHELRELRLAFERQKRLAVHYTGMTIGEYKADFAAENSVIVELKAQRALTAVDEAQVINCLKTTGLRIGLLFNSGAQSLQYIRRIVQPIIIRVIGVICGS
jgi:GxxExxY protein